MIPKRKKKRRLGILQRKQVNMDEEKHKLLTKIATDAVCFAFSKGYTNIDGDTIAAIMAVVFTSEVILDKMDYILATKWATSIFIQESAKLSQSNNSISSLSN